MTSQQPTTTAAETLDSSPRKPRKVLFLDIDGVLNGLNTKTRCGQYTGVDPRMVRLFMEWWRKHPDVDIVLSSTWRKYPEMHSHLNVNGIFWVDVTRHDDTWSREEEIMVWMADHPEVTNFAVLDDIPMEYLKDRAVCPDTNLGITAAHLTKLSELFK